MKEFCFSIAIESDEKSNTVLGKVVVALHNAGFEYMSVKEIAAQKHWNSGGTDNQQLKAEIAALVSKWSEMSTGEREYYGFNMFLEELRLLSAV